MPRQAAASHSLSPPYEHTRHTHKLLNDATTSIFAERFLQFVNLFVLVLEERQLGQVQGFNVEWLVHSIHTPNPLPPIGVGLSVSSCHSRAESESHSSPGLTTCVLLGGPDGRGSLFGLSPLFFVGPLTFRGSISVPLNSSPLILPSPSEPGAKAPLALLTNPLLTNPLLTNPLLTKPQLFQPRPSLHLSPSFVQTQNTSFGFGASTAPP